MSSNGKKEIYKDPRFAHLVNDPRYKRVPQSQRKIKIDDRFKGNFRKI